jgi:hypothetical protein
MLAANAEWSSARFAFFAETGQLHRCLSALLAAGLEVILR